MKKNLVIVVVLAILVVVSAVQAVQLVDLKSDLVGSELSVTPSSATASGSAPSLGGSSLDALPGMVGGC